MEVDWKQDHEQINIFNENPDPVLLSYHDQFLIFLFLWKFTFFNSQSKA
jgi:hypothetical protein